MVSCHHYPGLAKGKVALLWCGKNMGSHTIDAVDRGSCIWGWDGVILVLHAYGWHGVAL